MRLTFCSHEAVRYGLLKWNLPDIRLMPRLMPSAKNSQIESATAISSIQKIWKKMKRQHSYQCSWLSFCSKYGNPWRVNAHLGLLSNYMNSGDFQQTYRLKSILTIRGLLMAYPKTSQVLVHRPKEWSNVPVPMILFVFRRQQWHREERAQRFMSRGDIQQGQRDFCCQLDFLVNCSFITTTVTTVTTEKKGATLYVTRWHTTGTTRLLLPTRFFRKLKETSRRTC